MDEIKKVFRHYNLKKIMRLNKIILFTIMIIILLNLNFTNQKISIISLKDIKQEDKGNNNEENKKIIKNTIYEFFIINKNSKNSKNEENQKFPKLRNLDGDEKDDPPPPPPLVCDGSCSGCSGSSTNCQNCAGGFYRLDGTNFYTRCYSGYGGRYVDSSSQTWKPCDSSCNGCTSTANNCQSCNSGYYKVSSQSFPTQCYQTHNGYYLSSNQFYQCDSTCKLCISSATNCQECNTSHYKILTNNFPSLCYSLNNIPAGKCYKSDQSSFHVCDPSCNSDTECLQNDCKMCKTKCKDGYYPVEGQNFPTKCYQTLSGHYLNNGLFKKCDVSCTECVTESTNCQSCSSSYYIKTVESFPTKCHNDSILALGYYLYQNKWKECDPNCKTCKDFNNCLSCHSGKWRKFGVHNPNVCNEKVDQWFVNSSDNLFHQCDISCNNCITNKLNCKACASNYFEAVDTNFPTNCFKHPHNGWFLKENKWNKCDPSCATCVDSPKNCLTCAANYYKKIHTNFPTNCFTNPLDGWFLSGSDWHQCDLTFCETCVTNNTNCTKCAKFHYKKQAENFPTKCYKCGASCINCVDFDYKCTECSLKFYRKNVENFPTKCYPESLTSWFLNENLMKICDKSCHTCVTTNINCIQCSTDYYFLEDKKNCHLHSASPVGYYYNTSYKLHKFCDKSCYTCSDTFICTKCAENYFPLEDVSHRCIHKDVDSYTNPDTNISYYYNSEAKNYSKCAINCKTCSTKPDYCLICNYDAEYFHLEDKKNTCLNECPLFYFRNFLKKECSNCHKSCKKCSDASAKCEICAPDFFPKSDLKTSCHDKLPNRTYVFDKEKLYWWKCPFPGLYCDEKFRFIECVEGYFWLEHAHSCLKECPDGFWADPSVKKCVKCTEPCLTCKNNFTCKSCISSHYFVKEFPEANCVEKCPDKFYPVESPKICAKCIKECATCTSEKVCKSCEENFYHNPDTMECKEFCADGYIKKEENRSCEKCDKNCRTCKGKIDTCTSCKDSYLLNEKCVKDCPSNMYKDNIWWSCDYCHNTCLTCSGSRDKDCLSCDEEKEYTLIFGFCSAGCPASTVREKDGVNCINFGECFNSIILSAPKLFSITDKDFEAKLNFKLKEKCLNYRKDMTFKWDEIEGAEYEGQKLVIKNQNLKDGRVPLGILISYNSVGISKLKYESTLVTYKLIADITNSENLNSIYGLEIKISGKLSKDEGFKGKEEDPDLKYQWICSGSLAALCEKIDSSELIIPFKDYEALIKKPKKNLEFEIELIISKDTRISKKKAKLKLKKPIEIKKKGGKAIDLDLTDLIIISPKNSGGLKNIIFQISFALPSLKFSDYKYHWTIKSFKSDKQYLNSRVENNLKILRDDLLSGINEIKLVVTDPKNKKSYKKIYKYLKPQPPYGGRCDLPKQNGISLKDDFEFKISGWISKKKPLLFKIKFLNDEENFLDISMGGFLEEKFVTKNLPVGESFFLEAIDSGGLSAIVPCQLKVLPNNQLMKMEDYLEGVFEPVKKMIIMDIFKSNLANGGSLAQDSSQKEKIDPRIAINDQALEMLSNLLNSGEDPSDSLENVTTSLLTVSPEPYSDSSILIAVNCLEVIVNYIEAIMDKEENVKMVFKIGDNLLKKIELAKEKENLDPELREKLGDEILEKIQNFKTVINDKLFNNVVSGQSLVISTPAVDVKLTKASSLNVPTVAMEYEDDKRMKKNRILLEEKERKKAENKNNSDNTNNDNNDKNNIRSNLIYPEKIYPKRHIRNTRVRYLQNNSDECDPDVSAFCMDKGKMGTLMSSQASDSVGFKGELNKDVVLPIKQEQFSNSMNFHFTDEDKNGRRLTEGEGGLSFDFEVRLKLPKNKKISEMGPATCLQYENGKVADVSCMSYYDLDTKETVCACVKQGLTVNVKDPKLAALSKLRQFPPLMDSFFNIYSIGIVGGFMLLFFINFFLGIIFDQIDSKSLKYQMLENYDFMQFYLNKYHKHGFENDVGIFRLFCYLMKNLHPIFSILTIYHPGYNRPLRIMDYFLQIYFTFFFTFMRFYMFGNPKADAFKDDRSIKNRGRNINDINYSIEEKIIGVGYSVAASIITAVITQVLQLWLYENVVGNDLKRKTKMLKRNMLNIDEDHTPMYKIKLKMAYYKIRCCQMIIPKQLKLSQKQENENKNSLDLSKIKNTNNKLDLSIENSKYNKDKDKSNTKDKSRNNNSGNSISIEAKGLTENNFSSQKKLLTTMGKNNNNPKEKMSKKEEIDYDKFTQIQGLSVKSVLKKENILQKISEKSEKYEKNSMSNYSKIPEYSNLDIYDLNNPYIIQQEINSKHHKDTKGIKTNFDQRNKNIKIRNKSKLYKENIISKNFMINEDLSDRSLLSKSKINNKSILDLSNNALLNLNKEQNINENNISFDNENNDMENINNKSYDHKNFEIEKFHVIFKSKEKNKGKTNLKIFEKKRPFIFPLKKNVISCFYLNITPQKKIKITSKNLQSTIKIFVIMSLYFFMWLAMAIFINNLVEKYGSSTFSVCILPIFTMFLVKLVFTVNIQFFIMAIVLKFRGKSYLNIVKKPPIEKIVFSALVHPMALDHYESILFYQQYMRYMKFAKLID